MSQINYGPGDPVAIPAQYAAPLTGTTIAPLSSLLLIEPAGTIAAFTLQLPTNPLNGQRQALKTTQIVTALTVTPGIGDTVVSAPSSLNAGAYFELCYVKASSKWYPCSPVADPDPS